MLAHICTPWNGFPVYAGPVAVGAGLVVVAVVIALLLEDEEAGAEVEDDAEVAGLELDDEAARELDNERLDDVATRELVVPGAVVEDEACVRAVVGTCELGRH